MDVDLLAKMVGQLIVDNDQVGLPGVGTFVAEVVPATFSDRGYTINPPYRRLSFHPSRSEDSLLIGLYAESNDVPLETAGMIVKKFLEEFREVLKERKTIILPGLGKLRATRENNFFFVPDEDLDIFPEGYALKPVSLKSHYTPTVTAPEVAPIAEPQPAAELQPAAAVKEQESEVVEAPVATVAPVAEQEPAIVLEPEPEIVETSASEPEPVAAVESEPIVTEPEPELIVVAEPVEVSEPKPVEVAESVAEPEPAMVINQKIMEEHIARKKKHSNWWVPFVILLLIAVVALAAFLVLASVAPDFVDSILYTPEELRIINY